MASKLKKGFQKIKSGILENAENSRPKFVRRNSCPDEGTQTAHSSNAPVLQASFAKKDHDKDPSNKNKLSNSHKGEPKKLLSTSSKENPSKEKTPKNLKKLTASSPNPSKEKPPKGKNNSGRPDRSLSTCSTESTTSSSSMESAGRSWVFAPRSPSCSPQQQKRNPHGTGFTPTLSASVLPTPTLSASVLPSSTSCSSLPSKPVSPKIQPRLSASSLKNTLGAIFRSPPTSPQSVRKARSPNANSAPVIELTQSADLHVRMFSVGSSLATALKMNIFSEFGLGNANSGGIAVMPSRLRPSETLAIRVSSHSPYEPDLRAKLPKESQPTIFLVIIPDLEPTTKSDVVTTLREIASAGFPASAVFLIRDLGTLSRRDTPKNRNSILFGEVEVDFNARALQKGLFFARQIGAGGYAEGDLADMTHVTELLERSWALVHSPEYAQRMSYLIEFQKGRLLDISDWFLGKAPHGTASKTFGISDTDLQATATQTKIYQLLVATAAGNPLQQLDESILKSLLFCAPRKFVIWCQSQIHDQPDGPATDLSTSFEQVNASGATLAKVEKIIKRFKTPKLSSYFLNIKIKPSQMFSTVTNEIVLSNTDKSSGVAFIAKINSRSYETCFVSVTPQSGTLGAGKQQRFKVNCTGLFQGMCNELLEIAMINDKTKTREVFLVPVSIAVPDISETNSKKAFWEISPERIVKNGKVGGAAAQIFTAELDGRQVAIKEWGFGLRDDEPLDFRRELEVLQEVHHPNLVSLIGVSSLEASRRRLVTEYFPYGSLDKVLANPPVALSWSEKVSMGVDVCRGMAYLHGLGKIHRDLKSPNILISTNLVAKIADFGEARQVDSNMTVMVGTFFWMAPEVLTGSSYSFSADVFSYGITLWELATGQLPVRRENQIIMGKDLPIPSSVPEEYKAIIKACWSLKPLDRPSFPFILDKLDYYCKTVSNHHQVDSVTKQDLKNLEALHLSDDEEPLNTSHGESFLFL